MKTGQPLSSPDRLAEKRLEAERMQDVLLLLTHLVEREEATVKVILDCLYDVGSVNLIRNKLRPRILQRFVKPVARVSKPPLRSLGIYWFKQNCPKLIADWLHSQITFEEEPAAPEPIPVVKVQALPVVDDYQRQIQRLRSRVRWLTGILVGMVTVFGGAAFWLGYQSFDQQSLPRQEQFNPFVQMGPGANSNGSQ